MKAKTTYTWVKAIPLPFYTTKGLPWWKRFNEKNWLPQCWFCPAKPIFKTATEYQDHYLGEHGDEPSDTMVAKEDKQDE